MKDNSQENLLGNVLNDENKDDENIAKVLFLTTELQEKDKEIENIYWWRIEYLVKRKKKKIVDVNFGRDMYPNNKH